MKQKSIYRGIYEFEDPSGGLLAAKVPFNGTADLFDGTAIIVKPNQRALLIYKGLEGEILKPGTHIIKTENFPILTKLANWKFGLRSPLRCEIWFFSGNIHTSRNWGTSSPVMCKFNTIGTIPIRAFGSYNVKCLSPKKLFNNLIGSRNFFDISAVEEFVQGQLIELLPIALKEINEISELNQKQDLVSKELEKLVDKELKEYGLKVRKIQIKSILPPEEIMEALESRVAMDLIGDQKRFLLYKAANSLDMIEGGSDGGDAMQMMMGMMLGKGIIGMEAPESSTSKLPMKETKGSSFCTSCGAKTKESYKFCANCGAAL